MLAIVAASCGSPQILAVNHRHRPVRSLEVIEQPCVDTDPARLAVPATVRLERRTVGIEAAPAGAAEMVGNFLGVPALDGVAIGLRHAALIGRDIDIEQPVLGAE